MGSSKDFVLPYKSNSTVLVRLEEAYSAVASVM